TPLSFPGGGVECRPGDRATSGRAAPSCLRRQRSGPVGRPLGAARGIEQQEVSMFSTVVTGRRSCALAILVSLGWYSAKPARAAQPSIQDVCNDITEAKKDLYGILQVTWVPAGAVDKYWPLALTTRFQSPPATYPHGYCAIAFTMGMRGATA